MPSAFFDTDIFADIILSVHRDTETIWFVTRAGGNEYELVDARFDEAFKIVFMGDGGIPMEGTQVRVTCRSRDIPYPEPMDHRVRRGDRTWNIVGSEPNGVGMTTLILDD
jgi:hypothetical protein